MIATTENVYGCSNWSKPKKTVFTQAVLVRMGFLHAALCMVQSYCLTQSLSLSVFSSLRLGVPCTNYHDKHVYILYKQKLQLCANSTLLVPESPCNHRAYVKCINTSGSIIFLSLKELNVAHF